jgi:hypothetical protein
MKEAQKTSGFSKSEAGAWMASPTGGSRKGAAFPKSKGCVPASPFRDLGFTHNF